MKIRQTPAVWEAWRPASGRPPNVTPWPNVRACASQGTFEGLSPRMRPSQFQHMGTRRCARGWRIIRRSAYVPLMAGACWRAGRPIISVCSPQPGPTWRNPRSNMGGRASPRRARRGGDGVTIIGGWMRLRSRGAIVCWRSRTCGDAMADPLAIATRRMTDSEYGAEPMSRLILPVTSTDERDRPTCAFARSSGFTEADWGSAIWNVPVSAGRRTRPTMRAS